jgi:hypothetical protein
MLTYVHCGGYRKTIVETSETVKRLNGQRRMIGDMDILGPAPAPYPNNQQGVARTLQTQNIPAILR